MTNIPQTPKLLSEASQAVEAAEQACNPNAPISTEDLKIVGRFQPTRAFCHQMAAYYQFSLTAECNDRVGDAARTALHLTEKEMIGNFYPDRHAAELIFAVVYCLKFTDAITADGAETFETRNEEFFNDCSFAYLVDTRMVDGWLLVKIEREGYDVGRGMLTFRKAVAK